VAAALVAAAVVAAAVVVAASAVVAAALVAAAADVTRQFPKSAAAGVARAQDGRATPVRPERTTMTREEREELEGLAVLLTRKLAIVLAGENGYREIDCPSCRAAARGIRASRDVAPSVAGCPTCAGTRRLWSKNGKRDEVQRSDRELIALLGKPRD